MNIFKKIGSFATTSWRDFSELYAEQQEQQQQQSMLEVSSLESDPSNDSVNSANNHQKKDAEGSFELRKRPEKEIVAKKNGHGFFRRHFSKKKLQQIHLLDDPRSPTTSFTRTPILAEPVDILSPFNVQDMLSTVQSAVDLHGTPTTKSTVAYDNVNYAPVDVVPPASELLENHDFTGNVGDWNDFQFDRNDKVMTESLIVELSTLEINKGDNDDSNTTTTTATSQSLENEATESGCNEPTQYLLQVDEVQEVIEKTGAGDEYADQKCKIVGCIVKTEGEGEDASAVAENVSPIASTPKKSATNKLASEEQQAKLPRTPLQAISSNSPMVNKASNNSVLTGGGKKPVVNGKPNLENAKKKKITTGWTRQLPKAPATPLTPLFKGGKDNNHAKVVSHFDKENF